MVDGVLTNTELELLLKSYIAATRVACSELELLVRAGRYMTLSERAELTTRVAEQMQGPVADLIHTLLTDLRNDVMLHSKRRAARGL